MPFVSIPPSQRNKVYKQNVEILKKKIATFLKGSEPEEAFFYRLDNKYAYNDQPVMMVIMCVEESYALYLPSYLKTSQRETIIEAFLMKVEPGDHLIVFSRKDYDTINKYLYGKRVDVELML